MPDWFADAVDEMSRPALPEFDPAAALAGTGAAPGARSSRRTGGRQSATTSRSQTASGAGGSADDGEDDDDHPLSDVWGE